MLRDLLAHLIKTAIDLLIQSGKLSEAASESPVEISDTKQPEHGDYACNYAMVAAKKLGMNPRALGDLIAEKLRDLSDAADVIDAVEVAGPGFLNVRLKPIVIASRVQEILERGIQFAHFTLDHPKRINVEFVSVNPNGPITVGSGRGAAFGDTLSRVLMAVGHEVDREYYINDGVNSEQMRLFAESVKSYVEKRPLPEKGYKGDYVRDVANNIASMVAHKSSVNGFWSRFTRELELDELFISWDEVVTDAFTLAMVARARGHQTIDAATLSELHEATAHIDRKKYRHDSNLALITVAVNELLGEGLDPLSVTFSDFTTRFYQALGNNMAVFASYLKTFRILGVEPDVETLSDPMFSKVSEALQTEYATQMDLRAVASHAETQLDTYRRGLPSQSSRHELLASAASVPVREPAEYVADALRGLFSNAELPSDTAWYQQKSQELMLERQREDLRVFGVEFKTWFSEQSLHDSGRVKQALDKLELAGNAYRASQPRDAGDADLDEEAADSVGEALWLASHTNNFGDDKDRVLVRADGRPAYIAADLAYLDNKLCERGYDEALLILGPDHHGYIGRMYSVYQALEYPLNEKGKPARFEIVIFQIVRFVKDGKPAPMRKRDGNIYELRDLIDELGRTQLPHGTHEEQRRVGADVARFFYLMRSHDSHMDFDIDLATKQSDENPVFYVQYAHARICSVIGKAKEAGISGESADWSRLENPRELSLIKKILDLPLEVQRCAREYTVHRLTTFAIELARAFHYFYDGCRVVQPSEPELSKARVALCDAARIGLRATFELLGVSAPERMERATVE